jgi:deoxyribodipyrimidine photo-lyase
MKSLYWFRNDLRLNDNLSLNVALEKSDEILFVYIYDIANDKNCAWGFKRVGQHRKLFLSQGLKELKAQLSERGHQLNTYVDDSVSILIKLVEKYRINTIYCESIKSFDEAKQIESIKNAGIDVCSLWQSSLFMQDQLPFGIKELPNVFTDFRKRIELRDIKPHKPVSISKNIFNIDSITEGQCAMLNICPITINYQKSSFPISHKDFIGGEKSGISYLKKYFNSENPCRYKKTRNELMGVNFSTKFSPWLSMGYISPRQVFFFLHEYEKRETKNESTYWIFFELMWRDYFRFIFEKFGKIIFHKQGLNIFNAEVNHSTNNFNRWIRGQTKNEFINAGMVELKETGFLSNRMRQIVASYLINELSCDWRAGAAWFESQLIDYDVYSNQCNWAYIAGCGTDPRGGRHFNVERQKEAYDPQSIYQNFWSHP